MPRKRSAEADAEPVAKRRSARQAQKDAGPAAVPADTELPKPAERKGTGRAGKGSAKAADGTTDAPRRVAKTEAAPKGGKAAKAKAAKPKETQARDASEDPDVDSIPARNPEVERHEGEWYWLMKAEPESRFENGVDVRFSIDDLRAREVPEPWDGEPPSLYASSLCGLCGTNGRRHSRVRR